MTTLFEKSTGQVAKIGDLNPDIASFLYSQLKQQQSLGGVKHTASWTDDQDKILQEMAEKFARLGVQSIYDIKPLKEEIPYYSVERFDFDEYGISVPTGIFDLYRQDPNASYDGPSPTSVRQATAEDLRQLSEKGTISETVGTFNSITGEQLPTGPGRWEKGALTNSAGNGFTFYDVNFTDQGIPVPISSKQQTGLNRFAIQAREFVTDPAVLAALAVVFGPQVYSYLAGETAAAAGAEAVAAGAETAGASGAAGGSATYSLAPGASPTIGGGALGTGVTTGGTGFTAGTGAAPGLTSMGGGTGLTVPVAGGVVGQTGLTAAEAVSLLGDPSSFINNPSVLGTPVSGMSPTGTPLPGTVAAGAGLNLLDLAKGVSNIADALNPDQQTQTPVMMGGGQSRPAGVDFSSLLGLLSGKASLLPAAQQYQRGLLG